MPCRKITKTGALSNLSIKLLSYVYTIYKNCAQKFCATFKLRTVHFSDLRLCVFEAAARRSPAQVATRHQSHHVPEPFIPNF